MRRLSCQTIFLIILSLGASSLFAGPAEDCRKQTTGIWYQNKCFNRLSVQDIHSSWDFPKLDKTHDKAGDKLIKSISLCGLRYGQAACLFDNKSIVSPLKQEVISDSGSNQKVLLTSIELDGKKVYQFSFFEP